MADALRYHKISLKAPDPDQDRHFIHVWHVVLPERPRQALCGQTLHQLDVMSGWGPVWILTPVDLVIAHKDPRGYCGQCYAQAADLTGL
jgi:hypothetical protein